MGKYGLPYQGSKSKLAERIVSLLPPATHLYDLFAGGCAVSHCALLSGKWGKVSFNDISDSVMLFKDVLEGNCPDGSEWISREEFYRRKDSDPYVRLVWSFANNQRDYLYSRQLEPYKKAVHEMIFAPTPTERRLKFKEVCRLMPTIAASKPFNTENTERSAALNAKFGGGISNRNNERNAAGTYSQTAISRGSTPPIADKMQLHAVSGMRESNQWSVGGDRLIPIADRGKTATSQGRGSSALFTWGV